MSAPSCVASRDEAKILVYDRVHPEEPFGHTDHRDAPTAYGDDVEPGVEQVLYGVQFNDFARLGRRDHAPPAAVGVRLEYPVGMLLVQLRELILGVEFAHELVWIAETGIGDVHADLCDQRNRPARLVRKAAPLEHVVERLLDLVADGALRVRDAAYQRDDVHPRDRAGDFRAQHDEAHLRTVAVGNQHLPALLDDVGDVFHRLAQREVLVFDALLVAVLDEGVAPNGDDRKFPAHGVAPDEEGESGGGEKEPFWRRASFSPPPDPLPSSSQDF